jgi:hypothetical protein
MPDPQKMLFIRPKNCHDCENGHYALEHAKNYAEGKGFTTIDLPAEQAIKTNIDNAISTQDPGGIYHFGHGNETTTTGDTEDMVFDVNNCSNLAGRVVYFLSCLTANQLGPAIMDAGASAYAGFDISWTWLTNNGVSGDPYEDKYSKGFHESANQLWNSISDGKTIDVACKDSVDKYNFWINYWMYEKPNDIYAQEAIKWLVWDREGLIFFPTPPNCDDFPTKHYCNKVDCDWYNDSCHNLSDCGAIHDETECISSNCYWVNGICQAKPPSYDGGNIIVLLPILLVVGLTFIAFKK